MITSIVGTPQKSNAEKGEMSGGQIAQKYIRYRDESWGKELRLTTPASRFPIYAQKRDEGVGEKDPFR